MERIVGNTDTIAAVATPTGSGGIGVIRISGPSAIAIAARLLGRAPEQMPDREMLHGVVRGADGQRLDAVLSVAMHAPRSYTGEDIAEIHGHGGSVNMARLLRAVLAAGARHAEPGEFTRRAFENGRMDLAQAEAVVDVINASSERAWRQAQAQLAGGLGAHVAGMRRRVTALLAEVEACIDFPEEGESYLDGAGVGRRAAELSRELAQLAATFSLGKSLRDGIHVALTGPVNSGKSSLFNELIGHERAIVAPEPGTTRDFVEAEAVWSGVRVTLTDTAGERAVEPGPGSTIEQRGIELGQRRAAEADLRVVVHAVDQERLASLSGEPGQLHILTKGDLLSGATSDGALVTSAVTGAGISELRKRVLELVCGAARDADDGYVVTSERQRALLEQAAGALRRAGELVAAHAPTEVLAIEVREAADQLATMTGERVGDEVLDALFARFCIGK